MKLTINMAAAYYGAAAIEWNQERTVEYPCKINAETLDRFENVDIDCMLGLFSLENITKHHSEMVGRIITGDIHCDADFNYALHGRLFVNDFEKEYYKDATKEVVDYLRRNYYDVGYGEITSLIKVGLAYEIK